MQPQHNNKWNNWGTPFHGHNLQLTNYKNMGWGPDVKPRNIELKNSWGWDLHIKFVLQKDFDMNYVATERLCQILVHQQFEKEFLKSGVKVVGNIENNRTCQSW